MRGRHGAWSHGDRFDLRAQIADRLPAALRMFIEAALQEIRKPRVEVRRQGIQIGIARQHGRHHVRHALALERLAAGQHLVQHAAERKHVAAMIGGKSLRLFRRHVRRRAEDHACLRRHHAQRRGMRRAVRAGLTGPDGRLVRHRLREAEVGDFHLVVRRDLDVGRLQIAMDDPFFVRGFERLHDLMADLQRLFDWHGAALQALGQRFSLDQFHDEEVAAARLLHPIQRRDVGMIQRGEHLRFALEPRDAFGVGRERVRQNLDRDRSAKLRIARAIDLAHAARAEGGKDLVRAETNPGRKGHESRPILAAEPLMSTGTICRPLLGGSLKRTSASQWNS